MESTEAARLLAGRRRKEAAICVVCGRPFIALPKAVYCSNACKQRAKYQRLKASEAPGQSREVL